MKWVSHHYGVLTHFLGRPFRLYNYKSCRFAQERRRFHFNGFLVIQEVDQNKGQYWEAAIFNAQSERGQVKTEIFEHFSRHGSM